MNTDIKLFLVITVFGVSGSEYCDNSMLKSIKDGACYIDCNTHEEYFKDLNVTYNVDFDSGLLVINFTLPPLKFCHTDYEVRLLVNEEIKDEFQCLGNKVFREIHSIKKYIMKKCKNETAMNKSIEQHGMVVFKHIFTGCYKLKIKPHRGFSSCPTLYANKAYIKTNFTRKFMPNVSYYSHYSSQWNDLHIKFMMKTNISEMKIEFSHSESHKLVYGRPIIVKEKIDNENFTCVPRSIWDAKGCTYVAVKDDRCTMGTLWTKSQKCTWNDTIECNEITVNLPIILSSPNINIVSAAGIAGSSILLVLLVYFTCKRNKMNKNEKQGEKNQEAMPLKESKIEILLLYPRDCKQFMKVMDSFRKFFDSFKNVEVYDCYSEDVMEKGPFPTLLSRISQPRLCTIIVDTQCAHIQQEAMKLGTITSSHVFYKDPTFMDSLFKYGLKFIMEDLSPDIYQKYYVIGLDGFSDSKYELLLPTGLRRYIMPNHLENLLADIKIDNGNEHLYVNSLEYVILREDIKTLAEFKCNNPYYLENILNLA
ncbi:hypothetical protein J437_LFUL007008 [Ladona fulva]|uniref:SEFIR domain-containing protein n=1 Tax=Ladona fulva TaxID=123851 RepID=A0A8K0NYR2_LADFU|nr:hypothetical protein J437_LFUL007008 [Ladona fulva]